MSFVSPNKYCSSPERNTKHGSNQWPGLIRHRTPDRRVLVLFPLGQLCNCNIKFVESNRTYFCLHFSLHFSLHCFIFSVHVRAAPLTEILHIYQTCLFVCLFVCYALTTLVSRQRHYVFWLSLCPVCLSVHSSSQIVTTVHHERLEQF